MDRRATWRLTRWTVRSKVKSRRVADVWHKAWAFGGAIGHGTGEGITQRKDTGLRWTPESELHLEPPGRGG